MLRALALAGLALLAATRGGAEVLGPRCIGAVEGASWTLPTDRYPHGALGDPLEWGGMVVALGLKECRTGRSTLSLTLPEALVFEDVEPVLADLDGDGLHEILTVESHHERGARLTVWTVATGTLSRLASTPFIGARNRWLAQVGAADLDGDGRVELAYIDRPHLARVLRVWRLEEGRLVQVAEAPGLTNHVYGATRIEGGIRRCGALTEIVTANAGWSRLIATRLTEGRLVSRDLGPWNAEAARAALDCRE